ncbi:MAG: alpha/beta hydrolase [Candidatus Woesearchaeota archaeon]|nr:alpha/beta hydrolase [Candidatus Woesearchaeota archaeon]MDP7506579.1 alpha/beta hydrolase [Candidatus Woesearchaeota archaeon]MDP7610646.1 alpha/beta hydrolase [Candidatus Woesearchaeota archaeon]
MPFIPRFKGTDLVCTKMEEKSIKSHDNVRITYFKYGLDPKEAPTLILLQGAFGVNHTIFNDYIPFLQRDYSVIAPDLRGEGKSQKLTELHESSLELEDFALDVKLIMEKEKIKKATLIGVSAGGKIALKCADMFQKRFDALILISSSYNFLETTKPIYRFLEKTGISDYIIGEVIYSLWPLFISNHTRKLSTYTDFSKLDKSRIKREMLASVSNIDRRTHTMVTKASRKVRRWNLKGVLEKINIPCYFITGKKDKLVLPEASYTMAEIIPNSEVTIIPSGNHQMILTQPKEIYEAMQKYLSKIYKN